jgi:hypothetical protein
VIVSDLYSRLSRVAYGLRNCGVSIVCAYNDPRKLDHFLCVSLKRQTYPFELLTIDNCRGQHPSAGKILNETARKARFPYIMFVHQDVALLSRHWLRRTLRIIPRLNRCGAIGVAGKTALGVVASVFYGSPPIAAGRERPREPVETQTLDGCLLVVPKAVFEKFPFDESHEGWYLYIADYCLDLARQGYKSYVVPNDIYHESAGPANPAAYEKARRYLLCKHRAFVDVVYTTVGDWKTGL